MAASELRFIKWKKQYSGGKKQEKNIPHFKSRTKNVLFAFGVKIVKKILGLENVSLKKM